MSRYTNIIDGANVVDIAKAELGFNYYLFTRTGGSGLIMRETADETEYRFFLFGSGDIQTIWDDRANKTYIRTGNIKSL